MTAYPNTGAAERRRSRGFTLIEMMIVVAIIGIIAGIVAINYAHSKSNAEVAASEADLKQIGTALELYYSDNQSYPASAAVTPTLFGAASNQYMDVAPNSPGGSGGQYTYTLDSAASAYTVTDPATYDSASLSNLPQGTPKNGDVTAKGTKCGATGCTHLGFSNAAGLFGY